MQIPITTWQPDRRNRRVEAFLSRPAFDEEAQQTAQTVLRDVRVRGDDAVLAFAEQFDGVRLNANQLRVARSEMEAAAAQVSPAFRRAAREAHRRIARFCRAGMKRDWRMPTPRGGTLGERFVPLDRVGVYVPGGAAPLASTALMTVTLARTAGVSEIVACTPCGRDGQVNPHVRFALHLAGATEVIRVGGIHAIGMLAYGTRTVPRVQKIVGPGGTYVTAAKRLVYGDVALDLVAGPSEIAVLADDSADPEHAALDLLSQAEHGTGFEKALLVSPSSTLLTAVRAALNTHAAALSGKEAIARVASRGGLLLVQTRDLADGAELCNRFAPEHLELMVRAPGRWLRRIRCAGAVFLGRWTPESAGDFVAGPSHVLPTGGAAAMFSGLTVDDFRRRQSVLAFTRDDLAETLPVIQAFGRVEGLDAHARSAEIRFESAGCAKEKI